MKFYSRSILIALALSSTFALADPRPGQGNPPAAHQQHPEQKPQPAQHPSPQSHQQQRGQSSPQGNNAPYAPNPSAGTRPAPSTQHARQGLPSDFGPAQQKIRDLRQEIGRGPDLPPGIRIETGKPLPNGYGKRLPAHINNRLPAYQGYEWRRVGPDMVLVALTTGIVQTILAGVLN